MAAFRELLKIKDIDLFIVQCGYTILLLIFGVDFISDFLSYGFSSYNIIMSFIVAIMFILLWFPQNKQWQIVRIIVCIIAFISLYLLISEYLSVIYSPFGRPYLYFISICGYQAILILFAILFLIPAIAVWGPFRYRKQVLFGSISFLISLILYVHYFNATMW